MSTELVEARTPSQQARRERILASAQRLLGERDLEQIQVREVADDAGVALGTLYRYFPSKDVLYAHALLDWSTSFSARVQGRRAAAGSDAERLRAALHGVARAYERAPSFFRLLTVLEVATDPAVREVFSAFSGRFLDALAATMVDTEPAEAETIAFVTASVLGSSLRNWARHGTSSKAVHDRIDATVDLLFRRP